MNSRPSLLLGLSVSLATFGSISSYLYYHDNPITAAVTYDYSLEYRDTTISVGVLKPSGLSLKPSENDTSFFLQKEQIEAIIKEKLAMFAKKSKAYPSNNQSREIVAASNLGIDE